MKITIKHSELQTFVKLVSQLVPKKDLPLMVDFNSRQRKTRPLCRLYGSGIDDVVTGHRS